MTTAGKCQVQLLAWRCFESLLPALICFPVFSLSLPLILLDISIVSLLDFLRESPAEAWHCCHLPTWAHRSRVP